MNKKDLESDMLQVLAERLERSCQGVQLFRAVLRDSEGKRWM